MARILKIKDLEERKKALVEESEVYRETLKLEIQNLRLYSIHVRRKFSSFGPSSPLMLFLMPFAASFFAKRRLPKFRFVTGALVGWKLFRKLASVLPGLFSRSKKPARTVEGEEQAAPM